MADTSTFTPEQLQQLLELLNKPNGITINDLLKNMGYIGTANNNPVFNSSIGESNRTLDAETEDLKIELRKLTDELAKITGDMVNEKEKWDNAKAAIKEKRQKIKDKNYEPGETEASVRAQIEQLNKDRRNANNRYNTQKKKYDKANQKQLDVDSDIGKKLIEILKLKENITKESQRQLKEEEQGLTLEERINEQLERRGIAIGKVRNGYNEIKGAVNKIVGIAKDLIEPWAKLDSAAFRYAQSIGTSGEYAEKLRRSMIAINSEMKTASVFGLTTADMFKMQGQFDEVIGRQVEFSGPQWNEIAASSKLIGEEGINRILQGMDLYGVGISQATEKVRDMYVESEKTGISLSKYSKTFLDNIRTAQYYTFRDGVEGLRAMARHSTEIRLNMAEVSRFADKVSTLEGALTAGANLSVLGGPFAMYSNPMQLLYEGLNDMEGLSERMENMFGNFVYWDEKKQALDMSSFNRQRVRAAAEATGVNYNDMIDMAFAKGRRNVVAPQLRALGINENDDRYSLLMNKAMLNDKGQAVVSVMGQEIGLRDAANDKNILSVLKRSTDDQGKNIATIAETLLGWDDMMKGIQAGIEEQTANMAEQSGVGNAAKGMLGLLRDNIQLVASINVGVKIVETLLQGLVMLNGMQNIIGGISGFRGFGAMGRMGAAGKGISGAGGAGQTGLIAQGAKTTFARKVASSRFGKFMARNYGAIGAIGGAAGIIGGTALSGMAMAESDPTKKANLSHGSAFLYGAGTGAAIGSVFGPWGTLGGAAIGGLGTLAFSGDKIENDKFKGLLNKRGAHLQGEYSTSELKQMYNNPHGLGLTLRTKIQQNEGLPSASSNDVGAYLDRGNTIPKKRFGGLIGGIGNGTSDSNLAWVSRGEYVMPAKETLKPNNRFILDSMRSGVEMEPRFENKTSGVASMSVSPRDDIMHQNRQSVSNNRFINPIKQNIQLTPNLDSKSIGEINKSISLLYDKFIPIGINKSVDILGGTAVPTSTQENTILSNSTLNPNGGLNNTVNSGFKFASNFGSDAIEKLARPISSLSDNFASVGLNKATDTLIGTSLSISPQDNNLGIMSVNSGNNQNMGVNTHEVGVQSVKVEPISINGTIKLESGGRSKDINVGELLNNTMFLKKLTDIIAKNLNRQEHYGFDKNTYYKKFGS